MPTPVAVYVVVAVGTVAAAVAFKEFVYEPHIAPRVERWAEEFLEKRKAKKMKREAKKAVPVPSTTGGEDAASADGKSVYELESLVANEVSQWRTQIDTGRGEGTSTLRQRKRAGASPLDESNIIIPYDTMTPTHILFDPTDVFSTASPTSTSTLSSRVPTPGPSVHSSLSHSEFRTPPPAVQAPPTPESSVHGSPTRSARAPSVPRGVSPDPFSSPHHVPSLSLSHPLDLDAEHDLELLSAPSEASSRPLSPFSDFSHPTGLGEEQFHSFTMSPQLTAASASETGSDVGDDLEHWSNAGSEVSGSSWASADARSH